jgi:hypothetical protein|tara:strand:+ start:211 stop:387 length:177 start_codon:yes stop_codon:yes gene_type:complete
MRESAHGQPKGNAMDAKQIQEVKEELDRIYEQKAAEVASRTPSAIQENAEGGERESSD